MRPLQGICIFLCLAHALLAALPCKDDGAGNCVCEGTQDCLCAEDSNCQCKNYGDCVCGNSLSCLCANGGNCFCGQAATCDIQTPGLAFCAAGSTVGTGKCNNFAVRHMPFCVDRPFDNFTTGLYTHVSSDPEGHFPVEANDRSSLESNSDFRCSGTVYPAIAFAVFVLMHIIFTLLLFMGVTHCSTREVTRGHYMITKRNSNLPIISFKGAFYFTWVIILDGSLIAALVPVYIYSPSALTWPFVFMFIPINFVLAPWSCVGRTEVRFDPPKGELKKYRYCCCGCFKCTTEYLPLEMVDHATTEDRERGGGSGGTWTETVVVLHASNGRTIDVSETIRDGVKVRNPNDRMNTINDLLEAFRRTIPRDSPGPTTRQPRSASTDEEEEVPENSFDEEAEAPTSRSKGSKASKQAKKRVKKGSESARSVSRVSVTLAEDDTKKKEKSKDKGNKDRTPAVLKAEVKASRPRASHSSSSS